MTNLKCSLDILNECIPVFEMLKDKQRQQILVYLTEKGQLTVNEIVELSNLSRPAISHHLKLLLQSELVSFEKIGTQRIYRAELQTSILRLRDLIDALQRDLTNSLSHDLTEKN
ncbi:ArsR/SmtB family transcription factor [Paenibacillus popilliae]|uniref:Predicted transcriptional regulator n=1 Tax=Paenibacillus popilliae ATCC 14706 TaxID=1212764 RepID=M9M828_PAEPP|nr:metalloregulator ArsR/SmtB family transcription factor [Paenibacillus popilliae]GAC44028.1 predicted transcriptional regulator [Paenibacillus popilliae ATCC 14706]